MLKPDDGDDDDLFWDRNV